MRQMTSNDAKQFNLTRIVELIDSVIQRESIPPQGETMADLGWIKFYARELARDCDCNEREDQSETKQE